jgi:hypothetical protein
MTPAPAPAKPIPTPVRYAACFPRLFSSVSSFFSSASLLHPRPADAYRSLWHTAPTTPITIHQVHEYQNHQRHNSSVNNANAIEITWTWRLERIVAASVGEEVTVGIEENVVVGDEHLLGLPVPVANVF